MKEIIGRKPVLEALNSGKEIGQIILSYGQKGNIIDSIRISAKKRKIKISQISPQKFKKIEKNRNTQGVIARFNDQSFSSLDEIIGKSGNSKYPLIIILDSIQDPHNVGAILRTADAVGADGIIITEKNSASINDTVEKTSAGAVSHLKIAKVNNLKNTIDILKKNNFWIVGTSLDADKNYTEIDYKIPAAFVFGNEEKGIRRLTKENCDFLVNIPMLGKIQSLNVSVSAGVILYEVVRQRLSN